jgi:hypothetical protein
MLSLIFLFSINTTMSSQRTKTLVTFFMWPMKVHSMVPWISGGNEELTLHCGFWIRLLEFEFPLCHLLTVPFRFPCSKSHFTPLLNGDNSILSQALWHRPIIPALERLRQENHNFETSLLHNETLSQIFFKSSLRKSLQNF